MKNVGIIVDNELNSDIRVTKELEILKESGFNVSVLCFAYDKKKYHPIDKINVQRINIKKRTKEILFFLFNRIPLYELMWEQRIKNFIIENCQKLHL